MESRSPSVSFAAVAPDVDEDLDDEEEKPPPPRLAAAAEEMLALATKAGVRRRDESIPDRLLEVLRLVGRLHELCLTEAGFFAPDPTPTNDDEIAWAAEREMAFLRR